MQIKVVCQCGQRFAAKDDLLGKRVRCPKCGSTLTICPTPAPDPNEKPSSVPPDSGFSWPDDLGPTAAKRVSGKAPRLPAAADARGWIAVVTGLAICLGSLVVGGVAFAIIAVVAIAAITTPNSLPRLLASGGGDFFGILMIWSALAWMGSCVSLLTGWGVCWAVPRSTKTRPIIQSAVGCVGASLGIILLMQLLTLALIHSAPSPGSSGSPPRNPAEWKKFEADRERAMKQTEDNAKIMGNVFKALIWLSVIALVASCAAFGYFLGLLGECLGAAQWKQLAIFFCVLQGAFALWLTLDMFVMEAKSPIVIRLCMMLTMAFILAMYGGLIYLAFNTRRLVAKQVYFS